MKQEYEVVWPEGFKYVPPKVDPTMKDHSNDPVVIQRTEEAKKMIEKIKFPPNWRDME